MTTTTHSQATIKADLAPMLYSARHLRLLSERPLAWVSEGRCSGYASADDLARVGLDLLVPYGLAERKAETFYDHDNPYMPVGFGDAYRITPLGMDVLRELDRREAVESASV